MKIIGLQGVYSDGQKNIDRLLNRLSRHNYKTSAFKYTLSIPDTYSESELNEILDRVDPICEDGDVIIAHSAGCLLAALLLERLKKRNITIPVVWFFNAGIDVDYKFSDNVGIIYSVVDPNDTVIALANFLPCNNVGSMGQAGYSGPNSNVIDLSYEYGDSTTLLNHGEFFDSDIINYPMEQILQSIASIQP